MNERTESDHESEEGGAESRMLSAMSNPQPPRDDERKRRNGLGHDERRVDDESWIQRAKEPRRSRAILGKLVARQPMGEHRQEGARHGVEGRGDVRAVAERLVHRSDE